MHILNPIDKRAIQRGRRLWLHYGVFWLGAIVTGLLAVFYAQLIDSGYDIFLRYATRYWWLPLAVTPAIGAAGVWLTRRYFPGAEGSGIPQVIATLHDNGTLAPRLLSIRILLGKILVSFLSILGGFTIGREGPTIHVGAALMFNLRRFYPQRFRAIRGTELERRLALAGAAAGLSAAFNAPLAGVVFAIEELTRSFEQRTSGVLITAIIFAGVVSLGLQGNYTYFGTIDVGGHFPDLLAVAVLLIGAVSGVAGGLFCWLLLNTDRFSHALERPSAGGIRRCLRSDRRRDWRCVRWAYVRQRLCRSTCDAGRTHPAWCHLPAA
jgi:H+/Cl- antiporter ClcA